MKLTQRVANLEQHGSGASIGGLQDLIGRQEVGEFVDWSAVNVDPALVAALEALPSLRKGRE